MIRAIIAAIAIVLFVPSLALRAQPADAPTEEAAPDGASAAPAGPALSQGEVQLTIETLGVGSVARPGEWAGIRVAVNDSDVKPRNVALRITFRDADGDSAHYQRAIVTAPGQPVGTWLYATLPHTLDGTTVVTVTAHAYDTESDPPTIGKQLGYLSFTPQQVPATVIPAESALIGIVGRATMGLEQYGSTGQNPDYSIAAHELTRIVPGLAIDTARVPDQWMGYAAFESIVWLPESTESLGTDYAARALREWVHRGGHLIIVAPQVGTAWRNSNSPLAELLPACTVDRLEAVDLEPYRALLSTKEFNTAPMPARTILHRFTIPDGTPPADASAVISGPDGCVVVRRLVGTGMVTIIGLDLANRAFNSSQALRADAFWNRILGKRVDTPSSATFAKYQATGTKLLQGVSTMYVDRSAGDEISRTRAAGVGILVALILFITYCLAFGFGGFKVLAFRNFVQHSWLAAAAVIAFWTIATWALATWLRPKNVEAFHLTFLDHVYGQPVQRARSWASVLLPTFGEQRVTLGEPNADTNWQQALFPWTDPEADAGSRFPDAREYTLDSRAAQTVEVPTRSTVKQFQFDWLGGPRWSMPVPASDADAPRLSATGQLSGKLVHQLPTPLSSVNVFLIRRQNAQLRDIESKRTGLLVAEAYAYAYSNLSTSDRWLPGETLELAPFSISPAGGADTTLRNWLPQMSATGLPDFIGNPKDFNLINFFSVLQPPDYTRDLTGLASVPANPQRRLVHTLDLAEWFTQPCLIITGMLDNQPAPYPITVDEQPCPTTGRTVIRWIYPLTPDPIRFGD